MQSIKIVFINCTLVNRAKFNFASEKSEPDKFTSEITIFSRFARSKLTFYNSEYRILASSKRVPIKTDLSKHELLILIPFRLASEKSVKKKEHPSN